jgi:hypothetical protein
VSVEGGGTWPRSTILRRVFSDKQLCALELVLKARLSIGLTGVHIMSAEKYVQFHVHALYQQCRFKDVLKLITVIVDSYSPIAYYL